MHELCLHKIGPDKSDQAIGPELQNAIRPKKHLCYWVKTQTQNPIFKLFRI